MSSIRIGVVGDLHTHTRWTLPPLPAAVCALVDDADTGDVVFLAHNGPTGSSPAPGALPRC